MATQRDITKKEAQLYAKASKKGAVLARLTVEIGWSRANARRQLQRALLGEDTSSYRAILSMLNDRGGWAGPAGGS